MRQAELRPNNSVHRALNALGDRWSLLIIHQAFLGATRYEEFRSRSKIPRSTLSHRMKLLLANGVMQARKQPNSRTRQAYYLSERGSDLLGSVLMSWAWGIRWGQIGEGMPSSLVHAGCGKPMIPRLACDHCLDTVAIRDCRREPGPGEGEERVDVQRMNRKRQAGEGFQAADVVDLQGDRWTGMVLSTQYFGIHRFDHMREYLNIASNILTDRLRALEYNGILERTPYELSPPRYEYWLTRKGMDLYPHALTLMLWGDRWLAGAEGAPVCVYHNTCGHRLGASVVCGECDEPLGANNVIPRVSASGANRQTITELCDASPAEECQSVAEER